MEKRQVHLMYFCTAAKNREWFTRQWSVPFPSNCRSTVVAIPIKFNLFYSL